MKLRRAVLAAFVASAALCSGCTPKHDLPPVPGPDFDASDDASADDGGQDGTTSEASDAPADGATGDGSAAAMLAQSSMTFPAAPCGQAGTPTNLSVTNTGTGPLAVSATAVGPFSVSPTLLTLSVGKTGTLAVTPQVPGTAAAGSTVTGSLSLFTNVPGQTNLSVPLTATASGATLAYQGSSAGFAFPASGLKVASQPMTVTLVNSGNAAASFAFGSPSSGQFMLQTADAGTTLMAAGATMDLSAVFTPSSTSPTTATSTVTVTGPACGGLQSIAFSGTGVTGNITGWPTTVDFGAASCGGSAPGDQLITLTNAGSVDAHLTGFSISGPSGFVVKTTVGTPIFANDSTKVRVSAPAVAATSAVTPITATLTVTTDADTTPHVITLTEEPTGAILSFSKSSTFGNFGQVAFLGEATQSFGVVNTGNAAADVTITTDPSDAFSVSSASFSLGGQQTQAEVATFTPTAGGGTSGTISVSTSATLCAPLPSALSVSGSSVGGAPTVVPSSLSFLATCGGSAPAAQSFIVRNDGNANLTWTMSSVAGVGASHYSVTSNPQPGLLMPGASATVTVSAAAVASPATDPSPAAYTASITINTDVPNDPPHVVTLGETPIGDQLLLSTTGPLRYGQVPINVSVSQHVSITNNANAGSSPASVSLKIDGTSASAYTATPSGGTIIAAGAASNASGVTFSPTSAVAYAGTVSLSTTDALCTPLPQAIVLSGTGTRGNVLVSSSSLTFGTDPSDPSGLVNCGATGLARQVTISNLGNQAFNVTALTLGKGSSSPFSLSGPAATLPIAVEIGGATTFTITPSAIPSNVANPNDATAFADTLSITTDAAQDYAHTISLVMQPRGAVIADTPLTTTWPFGQISYGSIGTFTSSIQNTGNAPVTVSLSGLSQGSVFGLASNPTTVPGGTITSVVGQFTPGSSNGQWSDTGTLTVSPGQVLCEPLPSQWSTPTVHVSGTSNSNPPISIAGALTFPDTSCGDASPASLTVTLTNNTNTSYSFSAAFNSGKYYCLDGCASDAGATSKSGTLAANGSVQLAITPRQITPGPGVVPGSAPYADDLLVSIATSTPTRFTVPVTWTLDGAVLSLPLGSGPGAGGTSGFYVADTTSGYPLTMRNTGNATASVSFAVQPSGTFSFTPSGSIEVIPGIGASPQLVGPSSTPACPSTSTGTATFVYSGPVCQPFSATSVTVHACSGTLGP